MKKQGSKTETVAETGFRIAPMGGLRNLIKADVGNEVVGRLNSLGDMAIVQTPANTTPKVVYSESNVLLLIPKQTGVPNNVDVSAQRAQISAIGQDTLTVALWDEDTEAFAGSVSVAKPPHLRGSLASETEWSVAWTYSYTGSDYQERTRTATGLSATKQRVNGPYRVSDQIWVIDTGAATGVTDVTYIDLNVAARQWWTETEGCDDSGDPTYAFIARGPFSATAVGSNFA